MKRIQRKRSKGWKMPENVVYVGRPSKWGNPFIPATSANYQRKIVVKEYAEYLNAKLAEDPHFLDELRGKDLACWCRLDQPCHADVLLERLKEVWL